MNSATRPRRHASTGFTLVELAITLAVLAVIMAIALPNFRILTTNNRLAGVANEMVALVQVARLEAMRRNVIVDVCPSTDGATCGGSNWSRIIVLATGQGVVRDYTAPPQAVMRASSNFTVGGVTRVRFRPDGFAWRADATAVNRLTGRLQVCEPVTNPAANARNVVLAGARVSVEGAVQAGATCDATLSNSN